MHVTEGQRLAHEVRLTYLMLLTDGTLCLSQMPSERSRSRISQAKMPGSLRFSCLSRDKGQLGDEGQAGYSLDVLDDFGCGDTRLAAADGSGQDGAGLVVARQDLGDTAVRDTQLATDVTGSDSDLGHFDDADTDVVGKRTAVDEDPAELVHFAVSMTGIHGRDGSGTS